MKLSTFTQVVILVILVVLAASCRSSRNTPRYPEPYPETRRYPGDVDRMPPGQAKKVYGHKSAKVFAPGQRKKYGNRHYPLIIIRTPSIAIVKASDGRYYHKNNDGFYYWKGNDDRYYIDEKHLGEIDYDSNEYGDWKGRGNSKGNGNGNGKSNGNSNGKGNGNGKSKKH